MVVSELPEPLLAPIDNPELLLADSTLAAAELHLKVSDLADSAADSSRASSLSATDMMTDICTSREESMLEPVWLV